MIKSKFYVWLMGQVGRDDAIGDLAEDTLSIRNEISSYNLKGIKQAMRLRNSCAQADQALKDAVEEFRKIK